MASLLGKGEFAEVYLGMATIPAFWGHSKIYRYLFRVLSLYPLIVASVYNR